MCFKKDRCFPGLLQVFDLQPSDVDMPWLDTGIESTIGCSQMCPGYIQESNLEIVVNRCALARYRNRIYNRLFTDVPWLDTCIESGNSCQQIFPGWIQESDLEL